VIRKITYLDASKKPETIWIMEGLDGSTIAYYNTLHKGDNITVDTNFDSSANGSYKILRKYRRGDKMRLVLRKNEE
jgi:hypothetical protein